MLPVEINNCQFIKCCQFVGLVESGLSFNQVSMHSFVKSAGKLIVKICGKFQFGCRGLKFDQ